MLAPGTDGVAGGAALVLPGVKGRVRCLALGVPGPDVGLVDLTLTLARGTTVEGINAAMRAAADGPLRGILAVSDEPLVSVDFLKDSHSSIFDALSTMMLGDRTAKVLAWYDNEWGVLLPGRRPRAAHGSKSLRGNGRVRNQRVEGRHQDP